MNFLGAVVGFSRGHFNQVMQQRFIGGACPSTNFFEHRLRKLKVFKPSRLMHVGLP